VTNFRTDSVERYDFWGGGGAGYSTFPSVKSSPLLSSDEAYHHRTSWRAVGWLTFLINHARIFMEKNRVNFFKICVHNSVCVLHIPSFHKNGKLHAESLGTNKVSSTPSHEARRQMKAQLCTFYELLLFPGQMILKKWTRVAFAVERTDDSKDCTLQLHLKE